MNLYSASTDTQVMVPKHQIEAALSGLEEQGGTYVVRKDNPKIAEFDKLFKHYYDLKRTFNQTETDLEKLLEKHGIKKYYLDQPKNCNWVFILAESDSQFRAVALEGRDHTYYNLPNVAIDMTKITLSNGANSLVFQTQDLNKWYKDNTTLDMTNAVPYDNGNLKKGKDVLKAVYTNTVYHFICTINDKLLWTDNKAPEKPGNDEKEESIRAKLGQALAKIDQQQGSPASYGLVGGTGQHVI